MNNGGGMSRRDREMLYILVLALLIFAYVRFYFIPKLEEISASGDEISDMQEKKFEMEELTAEKSSLKAVNDSSKSDYSQVTSQFYEPMQTYDMDNMLTGIVIDHGLEAKSLVFGATGEYQQLDPYPYSSAASESAAADDAALPDISTTKVTVAVSGTPEKCDALADYLFALSPKLRVISWRTEYTAEDNGDGTYKNVETLTLDLEIYMLSEKDSSTS